MLPLHCKEAVKGQKHVYTMKELEIQTINMNKSSRELFQVQFTYSRWNRIASQCDYTLSKGQSNILNLPYAFCHRIKKPSVKAMLLKITLFAYKSRTPNTETISDIGWGYTKPVNRNRNKFFLSPTIFQHLSYSSFHCHLQIINLF